MRVNSSEVEQLAKNIAVRSSLRAPPPPRYSLTILFQGRNPFIGDDRFYQTHGVVHSQQISNLVANGRQTRMLDLDQPFLGINRIDPIPVQPQLGESRVVGVVGFQRSMQFGFQGNRFQAGGAIPKSSIVSKVVNLKPACSKA